MIRTILVRSLRPWHMLLAIVAGLPPALHAGETVNPPLPPLLTQTREAEPLPRTALDSPSPILFSAWPGQLGGRIPGEVCGTCTFPPDPSCAAGPRGILQTVNSAVTYYERSGDPIWSTGNKELFGFVMDRVIDVKVIYDPGSQRFYMAGLTYKHCDSSFIHLAVSKTAHPLGFGPADWHTYRFDMVQNDGSNRYWGDYTSLGFDGQAIYVVFNMIGFPEPDPPCGGGIGGFHHNTIHIFPKPAAISGSLAGFLRVSTPAGIANSSNLQPASVLGTTTPGNVAYFADVSWTDVTKVRVWALTDPVGTPSLTPALVTVPGFGGQCSCAPQTSGPEIDLLGVEAQGNAFWNNGSLWFCQTAGGLTRSKIYYYQLATNDMPASPPTLVESGAIDGGPGVYNYMPTLYGTPGGDVGIVFSQSSESLDPRVMVTARPAGFTGFPEPLVVAASRTYYDGAVAWRRCGPAARWGDYAGVSFDPFDGSFWITHELADTAYYTDSWSTVIGNALFPSDTGGWVANGARLRSSYTAISKLTAIPDGAGGAYVGWCDGRYAFGRATVQRWTTSGERSPGWPSYGVIAGGRTACDGTSLWLVPDGEGGVYVVWDAANGVFAQRLGEDGQRAVGWPEDGVHVAFALSVSLSGAAPDSEHGLLLAWLDNGILKAQRLNSAGLPRWSSGAVVVGPVEDLADMCDDGAGGMILAWGTDLHAQRLLPSDGSPQWGVDGVALGAIATSVRTAPDGAGGAFLAWIDNRNGTADVYATRLGGDGTRADGWPAGGTAVLAGQGAASEISVVPDGLGGLLIAWRDSRAGSATDIYAQRLLGAGRLAWTGEGVPITTAAGVQQRPCVSPDGIGGMVVAWEDGTDIALSHVLPGGSRDGTLPVDGVLLCTASSKQARPVTVLAAGVAAIVAWEDRRGAAGAWSNGVYAQRQALDVTTDAPRSAPDFAALLASEPNPFHDRARIRFVVDRTRQIRVDVFDLAGRHVRGLANTAFPPGLASLTWDGRDGASRAMGPGVYLVRMLTEGYSTQRRLVLIR